MKTQCFVNLQTKKAKKANENTVFREFRRSSLVAWLAGLLALFVNNCL